MRKIIISGVATVIVALLIGVTTWNFAATQGAVQKKEHIPRHEKIENKLDKILDKIIELHTK